ncbi:MAG TPA: hypothetical protein PK252_13080 [Bacteroidales bacterium]|nr:hypothetical protein [Bacteroidales bacterium]
MKRAFLLALIFISLSAFSQKRTYAGLGAGINNISGMAGLNFETPIDTNFSVKIGVGAGWGIKLVSRPNITGVILHRWGWASVFRMLQE